jgi:cephalosporin-C deacetylase-like acetyl esterase
MVRTTAVLGFFLLILPAFPADDLRVLGDKVGDVAPTDMMHAYLRAVAEDAFQRRAAEHEKLQTPEEIGNYQKRMRTFFVEQLGGFPERTPLNPKVVGKQSRDGYHIEKVIFESQPRHYVTAVLYLPDTKPPYPGVLIPCGHSANGKAYESYQRAGILLAKNGMAALCYDPIGQGERSQLLDEQGKPRFGSTHEHTLVGVGSILLGANVARYRIWDGMRALDYLAGRPEVDAKRLGCTGNSGGGTLTSYLMALDERIVCAAPSCYLTTFERLIDTIDPQDAEQNVHGQIAFGMDHPDYVMMRAPRPTLICCATRDFFDISGTWDNFRQAKRLYTRLGFAERVDLVETDASHGFSGPLRIGMARWMSRWLLDKDTAITESDFPVMTDKEMQCTPRGQVMLIDGARSVFEINTEIEKHFAEDRQRFWKETPKAAALARVREIAGIRSLVELPQPEIDRLGTVEHDGYKIQTIALKLEQRIWLPALLFQPDKPSGESYLYVHGEGKHVDAGADGPIAKLAQAGHIVLAVDLRGIGETESTKGGKSWEPYFGNDWKDYFFAYLLGKSYVGMRTEDILVSARFLAASRSGQPNARVHLVGIGEAGPAALHAAALEPQTFDSVRLERSIVSWQNVVRTPVTGNQLVNAVHGALRIYDLPDLLATLPPDTVTIVDAQDAGYEK